MGINMESHSQTLERERQRLEQRDREIGRHSSKWDVSSKSHSSEFRETHGGKKAETMEEPEQMEDTKKTTFSKLSSQK